MQRVLFKGISYLFHPILMPSIGLVILFLSGSYISFIPYQAKKVISIIVVANTFLIPAILIPIYSLQKLIKDYEMSEKRDRMIPMILTSVFYILAVYFLYRIPIPKMIQHFIMASAINVVLATIITFKWKISLHMIGIGGLLGMIIMAISKLSVDLNLFLIISIFISGLIGTSRLYLKEHNPVQIYSGLLMGFFITLGTILILS